jgi:hypothetical protein
VLRVFGGAGQVVAEVGDERLEDVHGRGSWVMVGMARWAVV